MTSRLRRRDKRLVLAFGAVVVAAAGVAYAAIPSSTGVISGCYNNRTGALRVIDAEAGAMCTTRETPISWNQQGPPGPPGQPPGPQAITVDCGAGEKVMDALAQSANASSVTITIKGTCTEAVVINRDAVVLQGLAPGDGLAGPSAGQAVLLLGGRGIALNQLTLTGGGQGLVAFGARFSANNLHVKDATGQGISVQGNATGNVSNSTLEGSNEGLSAGAGGVVTFAGGTIDNNVSGVGAHMGGTVFLRSGAVVSNSSFHGVTAYSGGSIELQGIVRNSAVLGAFAFGGNIVVSGNGSLIEGSTFSGLSASDGGNASLVAGARSAGNGAGADANSGGSLLIQDGGIVENNTGGGVMLFGASALRMRGNAIIRGNGQHGLYVSDTSVASFGDGTTQIVDNGGFGIFCDTAPSVALIRGNPGTVTGNTSGQVNCPNPAP